MRKFLAMMLMAAVAIGAWGCNDEPDTKPANKPTIGIAEPEFDAATMKAKAMIVPSTDAEAWYWQILDGSLTNDLKPSFSKEQGAAAKEIEFAVTYGVEYTIKAYAENKAGQSDIVEKRFCAMPEGEVAIAIGEITLNADTQTVEAQIYPSEAVTAWYWLATEKGAAEGEWNEVEGNAEQLLTIPHAWNTTYELRVFAVCGEIQSDEVSKEYLFELAVPTISVSKPEFDETKMELKFEVTPSEDTDHWFWGIAGEEPNREEGAEAKSVIFEVEYDKAYTFEFSAANAADAASEPVAVDFYAIGSVADIAVENLTAFTLDAVVTKRENCVRYVAGAVHTSAYDRNTFIEQAQSSLDPDPSYPFAVFNSATESRTFTEQDLVRNSRIDSDENAGLILIPGTSYTIAVYGEDANGNYNVTTTEFVVPAAEINGSVELDIEMGTITETSAVATVTASEECKVIFGYIDPAITAVDTENPFDFEGKSDEEIKHYIVSVPHAVPATYNAPITRLLGDRLEIGHDYYAYAIAIKGGKVGEVAIMPFTTVSPSLSGSAKIIAAEIEAQSSHETLTVKVTADSNAQKVRIYAAPSADHAAYADNLEFVLDANGYQNYREEYALTNGVATAVINIYHPGDNYYIYASAVDAQGRAGEMVCVAQMAGFGTDYYTTIEEVVVDSLDYEGTGSATLTASNISEVDDRVSVTLTATDFSANVDKVWFMRLASCTTEEIESRVKTNLSEYTETGKVLGSVKIVKEGWAYEYIDDTSSTFNPKYEALLKYSSDYGGDIVVMVILDTDGKVNIHSYFAGGLGVKEF